MCVVSMIGDHYGRRFREMPWVNPYIQEPPMQQLYSPVQRHEFEALKAQVEGMVALLKRAKIYDEEHGEPACEIEEKMALLRKVAALVGVDLDKEVLAKEAGA